MTDTRAMQVQSTILMTEAEEWKAARLLASSRLKRPSQSSAMSILSSISAALDAQRYDDALRIAQSSTSVRNPELENLILQSQFRSEAAQGYTLSLIQGTLGSISDDVWVAITCASIIDDDLEVMEASIALGLKRTENLGLRTAQPDAPTNSGKEHLIQDSHLSTSKQRDVIQAWKVLNTFAAKLATFRELQAVHISSQDTDVELELDDPWADNEEEEEADARPQADQTLMDLDVTQRAAIGSHPSLSSFLSRSPLDLALELAAAENFKGLTVLQDNHPSDIWPYRFAILESIPPYTHPVTFEAFLPSLDATTNLEDAPTAVFLQSTDDLSQSVTDRALIPEIGPLGESALTEWYMKRIESIEACCGLVDVALAWVQHGVTKGIMGLDALGEELSLLARLVYDAPQASTGEDEWSLHRWRQMNQTSVVQAYLAHSTPETLASDIRRLVLPYLYVESAKLERAGRPDPSLIRRILHEYILSTSLTMSLAAFEASKATIPSGERIITNDLDVARLALARLYGSDELDDWTTMSRIFECLPVWEVSTDRDLESDREATVTTLESLGAFVAPSAAQRHPPTPKDLSLFFEPLPFVSLSRALDILDVHLESGEILARWNVPAPLRWFLQASFDKEEQRRWAVKMSRMAAGRAGTGVGGVRFGVDNEWTGLMEDMIKLSGGGEGLLRGAFGLLEKEEILKIYLGGILSSGKIDLAKSLLRTPTIRSELPPAVVEEVALAVSREYFENAESGNMHTGEMATAWECLSICPVSPAIKKEQDLIEATSRISSFNLISPSSNDTLLPLEIRQTENKLDLIKLVISSGHADREWYKHPEVLLELAIKLGVVGEVGQLKILGMLSEEAVVAEEWNSAANLVERMIPPTLALRQRKPRSEQQVIDRDEAVEVTWRACSQLGRQTEWPEIEQKMALLGRGMELCPKDRIGELLAAWRKLEDGQAKLEKAAKNRNDVANKHKRQASDESVASPQKGQMSDQLLGSKSAARAAKRLNTMAADLSSNLASNLRPLSTGMTRPLSSASHRPSVGHSRNLSGGGAGSIGASGEHSPARSDQTGRLRDSLSDLGGDAVEMRQQARRALVKGVGWLIGAGEDELGGV